MGPGYGCFVRATLPCVTATITDIVRGWCHGVHIFTLHSDVDFGRPFGPFCLNSFKLLHLGQLAPMTPPRALRALCSSSISDYFSPDVTQNWQGGQVCHTCTWGCLVWNHPKFLWPIFNVVVITLVDDFALGHCAKAERAKDSMVKFHCFVLQATGTCWYMWTFSYIYIRRIVVVGQTSTSQNTILHWHTDHRGAL